MPKIGIGGTGNVDHVQMDEQASTPSTPGTGKSAIFLKSDGLYVIDDAGTVTGPLVDATGGGTSRTLISEQTPTGTTATFSAIPGTYKSLELEIIARTDNASNTTACHLYFNSDTTAANYRRESLTQSSTTVTGGAADNPISIVAIAANGLASNAGYAFVRMLYYALTTFHKVAHVRNAYREGATTSNQNFQSVYWENTAAITQIDIVTSDGSNFITGTTLRLYGIN